MKNTTERHPFVVMPSTPQPYIGDSGRIDGTSGLAQFKYEMPLMKDGVIAEFDSFEEAVNFATENGYDEHDVHRLKIITLHPDTTAISDWGAGEWPGAAVVQPVFRITGDIRFLHRFEVIPTYHGTVTLRTLWSVGEPVVYAPKHWEEESLPPDEARLRVAGYIDEFCEIAIIG